MDVIDVIISVREAESGKRKIDGDIARVLGWEKKIENRSDRGSGNVIEIGVWYRPNGSEARKVPFYTESLQSAYELLRDLVPDRAVACCFEANGGCAQIEGMEPVFAKTVPLALCLAALEYIRSR